MGDYAWCEKNVDSKTRPNGTLTVGQKKANDWGLYDMYGNLWEWCSDWYAPYANTENKDPHGPDSGTTHILRGGSWHIPADRCRSAYRNRQPPDYGNHNIGFRVAVDLK